MIRAFAMGILAAAMIARADEAGDNPALEGIARFNAAYQAWDAGGFAGAAGDFRRACEKNPGSAVNCYWQGAAHFHRMLHFKNRPEPDARNADAAMEQAIAALETAVKLDPRHAESHALLGTLYGMKIQGGVLRAIRFGPRVQDHQKQALRHGPRNPRVRYLLGAGLFHTARDEAGRREALATLLAAEKLFLAEAESPPAPLEPRWGLGSCRTFIGRACLSLGDETKAAAYLRKALADHPNNHIARAELAKITRP